MVASPILDHEQYEAEDIHVKTMRVEFVIVSHDQGWCSDDALQGTYNGFTWFEAAILRPSEGAIPTSSPDRDANRALDWGGNPNGLSASDTALEYDSSLEVTSPDGGSRWEVQRNLCASEEFLEHTVAWDADGASFSGVEAGAGSGAGFVACLTPGDRIAVIARAEYFGWSNFVQRVEVSVYYGIA